jgi:hypothetical protein
MVVCVYKTPTSLDCFQLQPGSRHKLFFSKIDSKNGSVFMDFTIGDVTLWGNIWEQIPISDFSRVRRKKSKLSYCFYLMIFSTPNNQQNKCTYEKRDFMYLLKNSLCHYQNSRPNLNKFFLSSLRTLHLQDSTVFKNSIQCNAKKWQFDKKLKV